MNICQWKNWGIGARLIFITLFPITLMFCAIVWYSYHSGIAEAREELAGIGKIVATALAESSEYGIISGNLSDLRRITNGLVKADPAISQIDILDAEKKGILHIVSRHPREAESRMFEAPIRKQFLSADEFKEGSTPHFFEGESTLNPTLSEKPVGYVRVTMSPSQMLTKQKNRFYVQLIMASMALIASTLLALYLTRSITQPMAAIMRALHQIKGGNYAVEVPVTTGGEIGDLQSTLNEMSVSLNLSNQDLENKVFTRTRDLEASRNAALKSDTEKRKLIQKVNSIVEDERKSISVEIHDELNAALIATRLDSQRILSLVDSTEDSTAKKEIKQRAQSIINVSLALYASARKIVRRLRPEALEMLGLHGAVEEMVIHYDGTHPACRFSFKSRGDFAQLESGLAITAYRLTQEALSNVVKHACASNVFVSLSLNEDDRVLHIFVADNGVGFDVETVSPGIGIIGMRERIFAYNGKLEMRSEMGCGTEIIVELPLKKIPERGISST